MPDLSKKTKWIITSIAASLFIVGLISLLVHLKSPMIRNPQSASMQDIVTLFASGQIDGMSNEQKFTYLNAFVERNQEPQAQQVASQALAKLSDDELDQIKKSSVEAVCWMILQQSDRFNNARSSRDQEAIAREVVNQVEVYNSFARSLIRMAPNVQKTAPKDSNDAINTIMKYVPPANIAKMEPLALKCAELYIKNKKLKK
jgi:predicted oxidoreductase